jgi:hypothetical protein
VPLLILITILFIIYILRPVFKLINYFIPSLLGFIVLPLLIYFMFISIPHKIDQNYVKHYIKSIDYVNESTDIQNSRRTDQASMNMILNLLNNAFVESKSVDINLLNIHYKNLGNHYKNEFIKGLELVIMGYQESDSIKVINGYILLNNWGNWYTENFDKIKKP